MTCLQCRQRFIRTCCTRRCFFHGFSACSKDASSFRIQTRDVSGGNAAKQRFIRYLKLHILQTSRGFTKDENREGEDARVCVARKGRLSVVQKANVQIECSECGQTAKRLMLRDGEIQAECAGGGRRWADMAANETR